MESKNLIDVLKKQKLNLENLLGAAKEKQKVLINNKREELDTVGKQEEKLIFRVQQTEKERIAVVNQLASRNGLNPKAIKIGDLISKLSTTEDPEVIFELTNLEEEIKELVAEIKSTNSRNMFLIQHSRKFIEYTMKAIFGEGKKSILDRKV